MELSLCDDVQDDRRFTIAVDGVGDANYNCTPDRQGIEMREFIVVEFSVTLHLLALNTLSRQHIGTHGTLSSQIQGDINCVYRLS